MTQIMGAPYHGIMLYVQYYYRTLMMFQESRKQIKEWLKEYNVVKYYITNYVQYKSCFIINDVQIVHIIIFKRIRFT